MSGNSNCAALTNATITLTDITSDLAGGNAGVARKPGGTQWPGVTSSANPAY